jgi:hypothetical protein
MAQPQLSSHNGAKKEEVFHVLAKAFFCFGFRHFGGFTFAAGFGGMAI